MGLPVLGEVVLRVILQGALPVSEFWGMGFPVLGCHGVGLPVLGYYWGKIMSFSRRLGGGTSCPKRCCGQDFTLGDSSGVGLPVLGT